ncbi:MAG: hypothetical protein JWL63_2535 [Rhodocyclales bacterium]|nr:hypothetical protein [Rhodocyclales bacterium]
MLSQKNGNHIFMFPAFKSVIPAKAGIYFYVGPVPPGGFPLCELSAYAEMPAYPATRE